MYLAHFQFQEPPFSIAPDPRFLYFSPRHKEAMAHLLYSINANSGFVMLTGEVGAGKTTICRAVLEQMPAHVDLALILNPRLNAIELVAAICDDLGIDPGPEPHSLRTLVDRLNKRLLETRADGRRTILIIDEAQNLAVEVLEQVRLLTNLETNQDKLLQIFLIGQPELLQMVERRDLRQLAQRITARYHIGALNRRETAAYIQHRLGVAGSREVIFSHGAMLRIHWLSHGIPRVINKLCDRALLGAYAMGRRNVNRRLVGMAAKEVLGSGPTSLPWRHYRRWLRQGIGWTTILVVGLAAMLIGWRLPWEGWWNILDHWLDARLPTAMEPAVVSKTTPNGGNIAMAQPDPSASTPTPAKSEPVKSEPAQQAAIPQEPTPSLAESPTLQVAATPAADQPLPMATEPPPDAPAVVSDLASIEPLPKPKPQPEPSPLRRSSVEPPAPPIPEAGVTPPVIAEPAVAIPTSEPVPTPTPQLLPLESASLASPPLAAEPAPGSGPENPFERYLNNHGNDLGEAAAFAALINLWGYQGETPGKPGKPDKKEKTEKSTKPIPGGDVCRQQAEKIGLRCLTLRGNWNSLRMYDLPAVMDWIMPDHRELHSLVVGLTIDRVTLSHQGERASFAITALDPYWLGSVTLMWRPPYPESGIMKTGVRSRTVLLIRQQLAAIEGKPANSDANANTDLLDEPLVERIKRFQHDHLLTPDGVVGPLTYIKLAAATQSGREATPSLRGQPGKIAPRVPATTTGDIKPSKVTGEGPSEEE